MNNFADDLMDDDGENRALRMFLAYYGGNRGVQVGNMKTHLRMAGFNGAWPEWCNEPGEEKQHLTKGGAQLWIRHLISLEPAAAQPVALPLTLTNDDLWEIWDNYYADMPSYDRPSFDLFLYRAMLEAAAAIGEKL